VRNLPFFLFIGAFLLFLILALPRLDFQNPHFGIFFLPFLFVPFLLHLFTRPKPQEIPFSGTHFLEEEEIIQRRSLKLEEIKLLVLRTFALFCLFISALGPEWRTSFDSRLSGVRYPLFLVDGSASMWLRSQGQDSLERAGIFIEEGIRAQGWEGYEIWICKGKRPLRIGGVEEGRKKITPLLKEWAFLGSSDLRACVERLPQNLDRDLILFSDEEPGLYPAEGKRFRSLIFVGVGGGGKNLGFRAVTVEVQGSEAVIQGSVGGEGVKGERLRLHWLEEKRPDLLLPITSSSFEIRTLLPSHSPRAVLSVEPFDDSPWDNEIPLLFPRSQNRGVVILGPRSREVDRYLYELLLATFPLFTFLPEDRLMGSQGVAVGILFSPWTLPEPINQVLLQSLERGGRMIVFPHEQSEWNPSNPSPWVPGWIHPPQPVETGGVLPTAEFLEENPELKDLPWNLVEVKRIYPLGDPDPKVKILIRAREGLPVLIAYPYREGKIYLFLLEPELSFTNIHLTSVWVPLWLKIAGFGNAGMVFSADPISPDELEESEEFRFGQRIRDPLFTLGTEAWTGWLTIQSKKGSKVFPIRTSKDEVRPGRAEGIQILIPPPEREGKRKGGEDASPWFVGIFLLLWVVQGFLSSKG